MASQYFIAIKLDPHFQRFLRSHFSCESEIFEFPARHRVITLREHFVNMDISNPGTMSIYLK
jgi:hypothetical protein